MSSVVQIGCSVGTQVATYNITKSHEGEVNQLARCFAFHDKQDWGQLRVLFIVFKYFSHAQVFKRAGCQF